jgi:serine/threonine-protein kinase RsbW
VKRRREIDVRLPPTVQAPRAARQAVQESLVDAVTPSVLYEAQLLVSELVTNSLHHANLTPDDSIGLTIESDPGSGVLRVAVSDPGPGFGHEPSAASLSASSGRGLYLLQQIAHRWGVERNRVSVVWFELPLDRVVEDQSGGASVRPA